MRWSIIRLIWVRELRDQLRDWRTVFMIAVLPIFLYPVAGYGLLQMAVGFLKKPSVVAVQGIENLPPATYRSKGLNPVPLLSWFTVTPTVDGGGLAGVERIGSAAILAQARLRDPTQDYPPLFLEDPVYGLDVAEINLETPQDADNFRFRFEKLKLAPDELSSQTQTRDEAAAAFLSRIDRDLLDKREVDLLLVVPPDFRSQLDDGKMPPLYLV